MRWLTILCLAISATSWAAPHASVRLVVSRNAESLSCPSEAAVGDAVSAMLGYVPFTADAPVVLLVEFVSNTRAVITRTEPGKPNGKRELSALSNTCEQLASSVQLALSLVIDPQAYASPSPVAAKPTPVPTPITGELGVGLLGNLGAAPGVSGGAVLHAGLGFTRFSLGLEGRIDLPITWAVAGGTLTSNYLLAGLVPCFRASFFSACAVINAGAVRASSEGFSGSGNQSAPMVLLGGRVGATIPLGASFAVAPYVELQGAVTRLTIAVNQSVVWSTPGLTGALGVQLLWIVR